MHLLLKISNVCVLFEINKKKDKSQSSHISITFSSQYFIKRCPRRVVSGIKCGIRLVMCCKTTPTSTNLPWTIHRPRSGTSTVENMVVGKWGKRFSARHTHTVRWRKIFTITTSEMIFHEHTYTATLTHSFSSCFARTLGGKSFRLLPCPRYPFESKFSIVENSHIYSAEIFPLIASVLSLYYLFMFVLHLFSFFFNFFI